MAADQNGVRALELPPEDRPAYLENLSDPAVRSEVASLLASQRDADAPLENAALQLNADQPSDPEHYSWIGKKSGIIM